MTNKVITLLIFIQTTLTLTFADGGQAIAERELTTPSGDIDEVFTNAPPKDLSEQRFFYNLFKGGRKKGADNFNAASGSPEDLSGGQFLPDITTNYGGKKGKGESGGKKGRNSGNILSGERFLFLDTQTFGGKKGKGKGGGKKRRNLAGKKGKGKGGGKGEGYFY